MEKKKERKYQIFSVLSKEEYKYLKKRAEKNLRTLPAEIKSIIRELLERNEK